MFTLVIPDDACFDSETGLVHWCDDTSWNATYNRKLIMTLDGESENGEVFIENNETGVQLFHGEYEYDENGMFVILDSKYETVYQSAPDELECAKFLHKFNTI